MQIELSGAISASVSADSSGYFEWFGTVSSLGSVTAVATDDEGLTSSPATAELTSDDPAIDFTVEPTGNGREVAISGAVTDESPEGLSVVFSGVVTGTLTADSSGNFSGVFEASAVGTVSASTTDVWGLASGPASAELAVDPPTIDVSLTSPGPGLDVEIAGTVNDVSAGGLTVNITGALTGALDTDSGGAFGGQFTKTTSGNVYISVTNDWGLESIPGIIEVEVLDLDFSGNLSAHDAAAAGGLASAQAALQLAEDDLQAAQDDLKTVFEQQNNNAITQRETAQTAYQSAIDASVAGYEAAVAAAEAIHQSTLDAAQTAFDDVADALQTTYDAAIAQAQQTYNNALAAADLERATAQGNAESVYNLAMAAADLALASTLAAATDDYNDAVVDAENTYLGAVSASNATFGSTEVTAQIAFESAELSAFTVYEYEMTFSYEQLDAILTGFEATRDAIVALYPNVNYDPQLAETDPTFIAAVDSANADLAFVLAAAAAAFADASDVGQGLYDSLGAQAEVAYAAAILSAQNEHHQRSASAENSYEMLVAAAEQAYGNAVALADQIYSDASGLAELLHEDAMYATTGTYDQAIADAEAALDGQVAQDTTDYSTVLTTLSAQLDGNVDQRRQEYEQNAAQLNTDFEQHAANLQQTHDSDVANAEALYETAAENSEITRDLMVNQATGAFDDVVQSADTDLNWAAGKYWSSIISEDDFFDAAKTYSLNVAAANVPKTAGIGAANVNHVERLGDSGVTKANSVADAAFALADGRASEARTKAEFLADEFTAFRKDVAGYEADVGVALAPEFADLMLDIALAEKDQAHASATAEKAYIQALADAENAWRYSLALSAETYGNDLVAAWQPLYAAVAQADEQLTNVLAQSEAQLVADESAAGISLLTEMHAGHVATQTAMHAARTIYVTTITQGMEAWVETVELARAAAIANLSGNDPEVVAVADAHASFEISYMSAFGATLISAETHAQSYETAVTQSEHQREMSTANAAESKANTIASAAASAAASVGSAATTFAQEEAAANVEWIADSATADRMLAEDNADAQRDHEYDRAAAEEQRQRAEADAQLISDQGYWPQYTIYATAVANADQVREEAEGDAQGVHMKNVAQAEYDKQIVDAEVEHDAAGPIASAMAQASIREAQVRAAQDNVQSYGNYQEVVDTPAAEFEHLVTTISDILPWLEGAVDATVSWLESEWEIIVAAWNDPIPVVMAYYMGLGQGALNTINGVQDALIGIANLPIMAVNFHPVMLLTGNSIPYIPSPDWSKGVLVQEDETLHDVSKFLGGEGVMTLATLGIGHARHAGKLRWIDDVAHWITGNCFVAGTPVVMGHDPELLSRETIVMTETPEDAPIWDLSWNTVVSTGMCLPIALAAFVATGKKRREDEHDSTTGESHADTRSASPTLPEPMDVHREIDECHRLAALGDEPYSDRAACWDDMLKGLSEADSLPMTFPRLTLAKLDPAGRPEQSARSSPHSRRVSREDRSRRWLPWVFAAIALCLLPLVKFSLDTTSSSSSQPKVSHASLSGEGSTSLAALPTKPIEQVRVGDRVMGRNPDPTDADLNSPEPDTATWRKLELRMQKANGKTLHITLLRPTTWIESTGAAATRTIHLDMPEMDAVGPAEVLSIRPCSSIQPGNGQVVTGTFSHSPDDNLVDVRIVGIEEPIGCASNHRFWSESRVAFVEAGDLRSGEKLHTRSLGVVAVASVTYRPPRRASLQYRSAWRARLRGRFRRRIGPQQLHHFIQGTSTGTCRG